MANTFKVKTNGAMPASAGTPLTLYTVPSSTTTVVIGLTLCNIHTGSVTARCSISIRHIRYRNKRNSFIN